MILKDWLEENKRWCSMQFLANRVGINRNTMSEIVYGRRCPSLIIARRIRDYTKGEVSYDDILEPFLQKGEEYTHDGRVLTGLNVKGKKNKNLYQVKKEKTDE